MGVKLIIFALCMAMSLTYFTVECGVIDNNEIDFGYTGELHFISFHCAFPF